MKTVSVNMSNTQNNTINYQQQQADNIILRRTLYAAGVGLIPLPIVDAAALLGIQVLMIKDIAEVYEVEFKEQRVKSLITTLAGNVAVVGLFKFVPILGTLLGGASVAVGGAATTYALGKVFSRHFGEGGTLLDLDPANFREFFQSEFEKGKKVIADMRKKKKQEPEAEAGVKAETEGTQPEPDATTYGTLVEQNKELHSEIQSLYQEIAAIRQQRAQQSSQQQAPKLDLTNLQLIEGIGPKVETALKSGGITNLEQLTNATIDQIKTILSKAKGNFNFAVPDTWITQAKLVVEGRTEDLKELQGRLKGGK